METSNLFIAVLMALLCSGLVSFSTTPIASFLAYRLGAVDVPTDGRRMHTKPVPRLGGLAIFFAFLVTTIVFCELSTMIVSLIVGGLMIVAIGVVDDIYRIKPYAKLIIQVVAAIFPIMQGITIDFFSIGGTYYELGIWSKPVTLLWILLVTNAINLVDGLDGLSCGISAISSLSLLLVTVVFNASNPAKIFMGDTGALFLGYTMSIISIGGVFKVHAMLSFIIPMSIFGLPLFDTLFAVFRRLIHGQAPWHADRGHIHHRLIDLGFNQKQSVHILYAISAILGLSAVLFTRENIWGMIIIIAVSAFILAMNIYLITHPTAKHEAGYDQILASDKKSNGTPAQNETINVICPCSQTCPTYSACKAAQEIPAADAETVPAAAQNTDPGEKL